MIYPSINRRSLDFSMLLRFLFSRIPCGGEKSGAISMHEVFYAAALPRSVCISRPLRRIYSHSDTQLGRCHMRDNIEERACELAVYIIETRSTVRAAAKRFGISKSTVHKDISERLPLYNRALYLQVKEILEQNKAERHIRGGLATKRKYHKDA